MLIGRKDKNTPIIENLQDIIHELTRLRAHAEFLEKKVELLEKENKFLREENLLLRAKITSRNSSLAPSKDITKSTKSNLSGRKPGNKKPGGQPDHKGSNLQFRSTPDEVQDFKVEQCHFCKNDLTGIEQTIVDRQQVLDIPPVKPIVTEYVKYSVVCPCCNKLSSSVLPIKEVKSKIQYGQQIRCWATYFNVRQVISKGRLQELFCDLFDLPISQGTITNMVAQSAAGMMGAYKHIKQHIQTSKTVGSDETSCNISGTNFWLWAYQNLRATFLYVHPSRGYKAIQSQFPEGFKNATLVTDQWAAQLKTPSDEKQLCLQHLIRDTQKLMDVYSSRWAAGMQKVLHQIIQLTHLKRISIEKKGDIEQRLDDLLNAPLARSHLKIKTLQENLRSNQRAITTCLYQRYVPPTNNGTEQSVRKMKIKMKVAGCFRSEKGAEAYAVIQSIIDTAIKQNIKPLLAIQNPDIICTQFAE